MVVVAGGVGFNFKDSAVGAAIAYNYIGGSFDPANPDVVDQNTTATDAITAYIDNAGVDAGGDIVVQAGYQPATTPLPTNVRLPSETAISSVKVNFVRETGMDTSVYDYIQRNDGKTDWSDTSLDAGQTITVTGAGSNDGTYVIDEIDGDKIRLRGVHDHVTTASATIGIAIERGLVDIPDDPSTGDDTTARNPFSARIVSVTVGAAAANQTAIGGSISINVIAHSITAYISGARSVKAGGSILISGADDLSSISVAGGVAVGQNAGGIAVSLQIDLSRVSAYVGAGTTIDARGNGAGLFARNGTKDGNGVPQTTLVKGVAISATSFETYRTIAIGLAGGARIGVAASGGVTVVNRHVDAYIGDGALVNTGTDNESADQSVWILASDRTDHVGAGGSVALGGIAGIGAGIDVGVMTKETKAWIGAGTTVEAQDNVQVQAFSEEKVVSVAAGVAAGIDAGVAGAVDVYVMTLTTKAFVDGEKTVGNTFYAGGHVTAEGTVQVAAESKTEVDFIGGNVAIGGDAGIGGAVVVPIITKNTYAYIGDGAVVDAKAKKAGIDIPAGTFSHTFVNYGSNETNQVQPSHIENDDVGYDSSSDDPNPLVDQQLTGRRVVTPDTATAFKGLAVTALNQDDIGAFGVGVAAAGYVAVQLSADVHVMTSNIYAYIGDGAQVNQGNDNEGTDQTVLVRAANDYTLLGVAGGAAISGIAAVSPGVLVGVVDNTVEAYIDNAALVDAKSDVDVRAYSSEDILAISIAIGGSGLVGIGGAFGIVVVDNTTYAYIGDSAVVHAGGNVVVAASDFTDVDNIAIGAGIGIGAAGIGVGVAVTVLTKDTRAWIGAATVDAKGKFAEILLRDPDGTGSKRLYDGTQDPTSGAFGRLASGTDARGVAVVAESSENVLSLAIAGAGGLGAGVAGAVTVAVLNSDTRAFIDDGAEINTDSTGADANQDVSVQATNDVRILDIAGAAAIGIAGLAGGVDVGIEHNDTTAFIAGDDVRATRDVRVSALADRDIESFAISAAGGAVGIGAAVSVYTLGGDLEATYSYHDDNGDTKSKNSLSDDGSDNNHTSTSVIPGLDSLMQGGSGSGNGASGASNGLSNIANASGTTPNSGNITSTAGSANSTLTAKTPANGVSGSTGMPVSTVTVGTQTVPRGTSAFIGRSASVSAGRNVDLDAREHVKMTMVGGGLGVGGAGVGAGISVLIYDENVEAFVGQGASVSAGVVTSSGDVTIDAALNADLSVLGVTAGFGAIAGIAAAVVVVSDNSSVRAYLEDQSATSQAKVLAADDVSITATRTSAIHVSTVGAAAGIGGGVGAAVDVVNITGTTQAFIGQGAEIGAASGDLSVNDVTVSAIGTFTVGPFGDATTMGVAIGVGFVGGVSAGVAVVTIGSSKAGDPPLVLAEIRSSADLRVSGKVTVQALSARGAEVEVDGGALGFVAIGVVIDEANLVGTTRAQIGSAQVTAGAVFVDAEDTSGATVNMVTAGGGVLAGRGGSATATVNPTIEAIVGDSAVIDAMFDGSVPTATGNVEIHATSHRAEGNASAKSFGAGGIDIGIVFAKVNASPTVTAKIGTGTTIGADGSVSVIAESLSEATQTLDDFIKSVDIGKDTIVFPTHGLRTGDRVTYDANGNTPIALNCGDSPSITCSQAALQTCNPSGTCREYAAIVIDEDTIKLGELFPASASTNSGFLPSGSGVDSAQDTIRFAVTTTFQTGDAVVYQPCAGCNPVGNLVAGHTYFVRKIDDFTIKLYTSREAAKAAALSIAPSQASGTTINVAPTGLAPGDAVTYQAPSSLLFTTDAVNSQPNSNFDKSSPPSDSNPAFVTGCGNKCNNTIFLGKDTNGDGSADTGPGFAVGDPIVYRQVNSPGIGLVDGRVYFVVVVDPFTVALSDSTCHAGKGTFVDGNGDTQQCSDNIQRLALTRGTYDPTPSSNPNDDHTFTQNALVPLSLGATVSGQTLTNAGLVSGQTYYVLSTTSSSFKLAATPSPSASALNVSGANASLTHTIYKAGVELTSSTGTHELRLDFVGTAPAAGTEKLLGPGGASLRTIHAPPSDGQSSVTVEGGSGGVGEFSFPTGDLHASPDVEAHADGTSSITAGGGVHFSSNSVVNVSAYASNFGIGGIAAGEVHANAHVSSTSKAYLGDDGPTVKAAGSIDFTSRNDVTTDVHAHSDAIGLGSGANATGLSDVTMETDSSIGKNADAEGLTLKLDAYVNHYRPKVHTDALAAGFVAVAISESDVDTTSNVNATIAGGARVKGSQGVDVMARHAKMDEDRSTDAIAIAFIPVPIERGDNGSDHNSGHSKVTTNQNALVIAGARIDANAAHTGLVMSATDPGHVALYSEATSALDQDHGADAAGNIYWDANVVILGGLDGSPLLVVDHDGTVLASNAVTYTETATDLTVNPIGNTGYGNVLFNSRNNITNDETNGKLLSAPYPVFEFRDTLADVTIVDYSDLHLHVGSINVVYDRSDPLKIVEPIVRLVTGGSESIEFDLKHSAAPSLVDIEKWGSGSLELTGDIKNPIGLTRLIAATGDIADTNSATISTNLLDADAFTGDIGQSANRLRVDLVRFLERARIDGPSVDRIDDPVVVVHAGGSAYLSLRGVDRVPLDSSLRTDRFSGSVTTSTSASGDAQLSRATGSWTANGFAVGDAIQIVDGPNNAGAYRIKAIDATGKVLTLVNLDGTTPALTAETATHVVVRTEILVLIDSISAGTDANLELRTGIRQGGKAGTAGVRVHADSPSLDVTRHVHFENESGTFPPLDPAVYTGGTDAPIDSHYDFALRHPVLTRKLEHTAGTLIDHFHAEILSGDYVLTDLGAAAAPETPGLVAGHTISIKDTEGLADPTGLAADGGLLTFIRITGFTDLADVGTGWLDVDVNGSVTLKEVSGDMRVGLVRSRKSNVTLTGKVSILDSTFAGDSKSRRRRSAGRPGRQHHPDGDRRQHRHRGRLRRVEPRRRDQHDRRPRRGRAPRRLPRGDRQRPEGRPRHRPPDRQPEDDRRRPRRAHGLDPRREGRSGGRRSSRTAST